MKDYLVNYGYSLIYSTALPCHSLVTIRCAYETMTGAKGDALREAVFDLVARFRQSLEPSLQEISGAYLLPSTSPIQALMISGNEPCTHFCNVLWLKSNRRIRLYPIKSPTVPAGQERIRIILHAHNTAREVEALVHLIQATLKEMGLAQGQSRL